MSILDCKEYIKKDDDYLNGQLSNSGEESYTSCWSCGQRFYNNMPDPYRNRYFCTDKCAKDAYECLMEHCDIDIPLLAGVFIEVMRQSDDMKIKNLAERAFKCEVDKYANK